jgi:hypothetical protein
MNYINMGFKCKTYEFLLITARKQNANFGISNNLKFLTHEKLPFLQSGIYLSKYTT